MVFRSTSQAVRSAVGIVATGGGCSFHQASASASVTGPQRSKHRKWPKSASGASGGAELNQLAASPGTEAGRQLRAELVGDLVATWLPAMRDVARTGDSALQRAAKRVCAKIDALHGPADWLHVAPWGAPIDTPHDCVSIAMLRQAIRDEEKLDLTYKAEEGAMTRRRVRPLVVIYHLNCTMLAAWCELRGGFRHFRTDRIYGCDPTGAHFDGQGDTLRTLWHEAEEIAADAPARPEQA